MKHMRSAIDARVGAGVVHAEVDQLVEHVLGQVIPRPRNAARRGQEAS